ncbi:MAG: hypothetical protein JWQ17_4824 [Tardiphaga sp.]|nr:hypothetical protein [Tardiphaga sp.]
MGRHVWDPHPGLRFARPTTIEQSSIGPHKGEGSHSVIILNPLTKRGRGLIAAPMINTATILIARRRRIIAVWADVRV